LDQEEPFDVWPGVQNVFRSIEEIEEWDYLIVSDYWRKPTEFILNSCGITTKRKKLLTAELGNSGEEIVDRLSRSDTWRYADSIFLLSRFLKWQGTDLNDPRLRMIPAPHLMKSGLLEYPRFHRLIQVE
jgi:hypothetical protein